MPGVCAAQVDVRVFGTATFTRASGATTRKRDTAATCLRPAPEGEFKNEEFHGEGKLVLYSGAEWEQYDCQWERGKRQGHGTWHDSKGNKYVGEWVNGNMEGSGVYTYPSGDQYDGQWKRDVKDGQGTYKYADGGQLRGRWKDNKKHGVGEHQHEDGSQEVRRYAANQPVGDGVKWSDDGPWRISMDGGMKRLSKITPAEALQIADELEHDMMDGDGQLTA
jgi:hypothetical protein